MDACQRRQSVSFQTAVVDDQDARGAVANLTRIGRRQHAALLQQLHAADRLARGVEANAFVDRMLSARDPYRQDLVGERLRLRCARRALVTQQREFVETLAAEPVLLGEQLRTGELAELLDSISILDALAPGSAEAGVDRERRR